MKLFKNFIREEEGQDAIEYALLAGFVSLTIVAAGAALGANLTALWASVNGGLTAAGA